MLKTIFTTLLILVVIFSCEEPGPSEVAGGAYGDYNTDTLQILSITPRDTIKSTSRTSTLVLGERSGFNSGFVISFKPMPSFEYLDTLDIDTVFIEFNESYSFGENVDADVYKITKQWDQDSINVAAIWRDPLNMLSMDPLTNVIAEFKKADSVHIVSIPVALLKDWAVDDSLNYGLYFHPKASVKDSYVELDAINTILDRTFLKYSYASGDSSLTDSVGANSDGSVFNYTSGSSLMHSGEDFIISSAIINNAFLRFDFSNIPKNAVIYDANLVLTEAYTEYEHEDNNSIFIMQFVTEESPVEDLTTAGQFLLSSSSGVTSLSGSQRAALAENIIQNFSNGGFDRDLIHLSFLSDNDVFSVKTFKGIAADDKPKLIIRYLQVETQD